MEECGVCIIPPVIKFIDVDVDGFVWKQKIRVINSDKNSKTIFFKQGPHDDRFTLVHKYTRPVNVAPGLEANAVVTYLANANEEISDKITVTVNGVAFDVPIIAYPKQAVLKLDGFCVDFRSVVCSNRIISQESYIYNQGSKEGEFKIDFPVLNDPSLTLSPSSGKVLPHSAQAVKINIIPRNCGQFCIPLSVHLEGVDGVHWVNVIGNVVNTRLELLDYHTDQPLHCVQFCPTYYGTDSTESAILFNNSPEAVSFVIVLNDQTPGQELSVVQCSGQINPPTSLVTAIPNHGTLQPLEKMPIFFRFSPRWLDSEMGFKCNRKLPPCHDFSIFMKCSIIGTKGCGTDSSVEISLTGTALPVDVSIFPEPSFNFGQLFVGQRSETVFTLKNNSKILAVLFQFQPAAHFSAKPKQGRIETDKCLNITMSFTPNQAGSFKTSMLVDIIGQVADDHNPFVMCLEAIQTLTFQFCGRSDLVPKKPGSVFNPGITPKVMNEVGFLVDTKTHELQKAPRMTRHNVHKFKLLKNKINGSCSNNNNCNTLVAFPNDRSQSIRPSDRNENYETIFAKLPRHTYIDPDYSFTDYQMDAILRHKEYYANFIHELQRNRRSKITAWNHFRYNNDSDIGIIPGGGVKQTKIKTLEMLTLPSATKLPNQGTQLLSSTEMALRDLQSSYNVRDGLNALPTTDEEKTDCGKILNPLELHQITIDPPVVDFGEVCLKSSSQTDISIINNLDQYIHVVFNIDCRELRRTCPLSQVIPGRSKAVLPLIFESNTKGRFQKAIDFRINTFYSNNVTVFADVVPVRLELSTTCLHVEPQVGLPADTGVRGHVSLFNKLNYAAEFTWSPIVGEKGTAFSIRPANGTVDAFSDLNCEVVFHPSFYAPEDGHFALQVHGGSSLKLDCTAKIGTPHVHLVEKKVLFGIVPVRLPTTRLAVLKNTGASHSYFSVLDPNPFEGLVLSPVFGIVPAGGTTFITIQLVAETALKFDTRINIAIRGGKTIELRVGGTVEPPRVEIDLPRFDFGGVYCCSKAVIPFALSNKAATKARVEFDLALYKDFQLDFGDKQSAEDAIYQQLNPGIYAITLNADEHIHCQMTLTPQEVASYNFIMDVIVNSSVVPVPSPTPLPPGPNDAKKSGDSQHLIHPRPASNVLVITPRRKVVATILRPPLEISQPKLNFLVIATDINTVTSTVQSQRFTLSNTSNRDCLWEIDFSSSPCNSIQDGVFKILQSDGSPFSTPQKMCGILKPCEKTEIDVIFCPECSRDSRTQHEAQIPVILDENHCLPYQYLEFQGQVKVPSILFNLAAIVLSPVPLGVEIGTELSLTILDYPSYATLVIESCIVECEDGSKMTPVGVSFVGNQSSCAEIFPTINECGDEVQKCVLRCRVTFTSAKPVSFTEMIKFKDSFANCFELPITATADNCLFSCYPFIAQHRTDHHIVCEQGKTLKGRCTASRESSSMGEAVLVPCDIPALPTSRPASTATSSNFDLSSGGSVATSTSPQDMAYRVTPKDGSPNGNSGNALGPEEQFRMFGSTLFPDEDTDEGVFFQELLLAVQRWFSNNGWPGGPNPIVVPESLRSGLSKKPSDGLAKNSKGVCYGSTTIEKEIKTVYDMLMHLSGKSLPGINSTAVLPADQTTRVQQIYAQHATMLAFLRCQGACIAAIKPEYLLELKDYKHWLKMEKRNVAKMSVEEKAEQELQDDILFEVLSKRSWMDLLMQILKTLVLAKITPRQFKNIPVPYKHSSLPVIDPDPLCSNVYSIGERILLVWLNYNYEQQREIIWSNCPKGGVPPSRWVVNFDYDLLDGLVLGALLAAHVPFLTNTYLNQMYTRPKSAEQCLHNAICVVNAMRAIWIDYDIQAIDITDPNPVSMMLLCMHLYFNLPQYLAKNTIEFTTGLHEVCLREVKLTNPSTRSLVYRAFLAGQDARDFCIPKGDVLTISPKSSINVAIQFKSRFTKSSEAVVVFVGKRHGANVGSTLVFNLKSHVSGITAQKKFEVETPCYQIYRIPLSVSNPFTECANFQVLLNEGQLLNATEPNLKCAQSKVRSKKIASIPTNVRTSDKPAKEESFDAPDCSQNNNNNNQSSYSSDICTFFIKQTSLQLAGCESATIEVIFLPIRVGLRHCTLILKDESLGEVYYSITGRATLPFLEIIPDLGCGVRIDSASADELILGSRQALKCEPGCAASSTVYWKCEVGQSLKQSLYIPLANFPREQALTNLAEMMMSELELHRRKMTGTVVSGFLSSSVFKAMSAGHHSLKYNSGNDSVYTVSLDSKQFFAPSTLTIFGNKSATSRVSKEHQSMCDKVVPLAISFEATEPGTFPCRIQLTNMENPDDIRLFQIVCIVTPPGSTAQVEFTSPVQQTIVQKIPIVNQTKIEWPIQATIEGIGFSGPQGIQALANCTTDYPLSFTPKFEGVVQGRLTLKNLIDCTETVHLLQGRGERPVATDTISLKMHVKQSVQQVLCIPNSTRRKLKFTVESDLDLFNGPDTITILPGQNGHYEFTVKPMRRGHYKGVLAFVASDGPEKEVDSDGDEMVDLQDSSDGALTGYRVWYGVDIMVEPGRPEKTIDVSCPCLNKVGLEVAVNNPLDCDISFEVRLVGHGLSGADCFGLQSKTRGTYEVCFSPAVAGSYNGSLIMYSDLTGEFWYHLKLHACQPAMENLEPMECELGRWTKQDICLSNPSNEQYILFILNSNPNNYKVDCDSPIILEPCSTIKVPLIFMPSCLGIGGQLASITFQCLQLGDWIFCVSGSGIPPDRQDTINMTASVGSNSTIIVPFRNPTDHHILVDVNVTDRDSRPDEIVPEDPAFCLLLRNPTGFALGPKCTLQIPIVFAPDTMKEYRGTCQVVARREDGFPWDQDIQPNCERCTDENQNCLPDICWMYPLCGCAEVSHGKNCPPAVVQCKARQRLEQRLEVTLTGSTPSASGRQRIIRCRPVSPRLVEEDNPNDGPSTGIVVSEDIAVATEYKYDLNYGTTVAEDDISRSVNIQLHRQKRDPDSGLVELVFNVAFAPYKEMRHAVELVVLGTSGGKWKFPLKFIADEPEPDDIIYIEAVGLNQEARVGFRLTSQEESWVSYSAVFASGSDVEFSVEPQLGELPPSGHIGALISIGFRPPMYGKIYRAKLLIQTATQHWSYDVQGLPPGYRPPRVCSSQPMAGPHLDPRRRGNRINFVRENIKLISTAVSSPLKGAPLLKQ